MINLCHQGYRMEQNSEILFMRHPFWGFRNILSVLYLLASSTALYIAMIF